MLPRVTSALSAPTSHMTWTQLAGATVFVIVVAVAWRQVVHFIMREI